MNAVGDGADVVRGKHSARNFAVAHGDTVDVSGKAQRQESHIEGVAFPDISFVEQCELFASQNLADQAAGKLIVAGRNGRVRGEDAHVTHAVDVELLHPSGKALFEAAFEQTERKQSGVAFVHVKGFKLAGVEFFGHPETAEAEHDFLRQAIALIAAVKRICQGCDQRRSFRERRCRADKPERFRRSCR